MPVVRIDMIEGRTEEQKRYLVEKITEVICTGVNTTPDRVTVMIYDIPKTNHGKNGKLTSDLAK